LRLKPRPIPVECSLTLGGGESLNCAQAEAWEAGWPASLAKSGGCGRLGKERRHGIMTIRLSKELEQFVQAAVRSGLYAREDDVVRDALIRLKQAMPEDAELSAPKAKQAKPGRRKKKPMTKDEFHRHLVEIGLMSQLPDTDADFDDPDDQPIAIKGEPLSETVIRERR
jgi:Arc/MetJ-type ribon-helix-helix transcriptional regulator